MTEVKFCENNFSFGTEDTMRKIKDDFSNVDVSVEGCLGYCGDCAVGPFALVNDEMIQADTADELFEKIKSMI